MPSSRDQDGTQLRINMMSELVSKISWKNPKVYCVAVILLGLIIVIISNALTVRYARPHLSIRGLGLVCMGLGLFGILVAGITERTVRTKPPVSRVIVAKRVVAWEERICRVSGIVFIVFSMLWFAQSFGTFFFTRYARFDFRWLMYSGTMMALCVGMAILFIIVGNMFSKR